MSSTIKYKGTTIATAENGTKTLQTSGKYLEGDIEVTDVSSGGNLQAKTGITPTTASQTVTPDSGYDGLSSVQIDAMPTGSYGTPTWSRRVVSGQMVLSATYPDFDDGYFDSAPTPTTGFTVESKTVTPSDSAQTVTPTSTSHYLNSVTVNPITYGTADEGKVVSNGALVAQTSETITQNGTYDTTTNDEVVVNVSGGGGGVDYLAAKINGTLTVYHSDEISTFTNGGVRSASSLQILVLPALTAVGSDQYSASGCTNLTVADMGQLRSINGHMFTSNAKMATMILRGTAMATLSTTNAFENTPFASGKAGGTLYVPSDLIASYQSATNWSTILGYENNQILPIEGSIYENAYADGTPIT